MICFLGATITGTIGLSNDDNGSPYDDVWAAA